MKNPLDDLPSVESRGPTSFERERALEAENAELRRQLEIYEKANHAPKLSRARAELRQLRELEVVVRASLDRAARADREIFEERRKAGAILRALEEMQNRGEEWSAERPTKAGYYWLWTPDTETACEFWHGHEDHEMAPTWRWLGPIAPPEPPKVKS